MLIKCKLLMIWKVCAKTCQLIPETNSLSVILLNTDKLVAFKTKHSNRNDDKL